MYLFLEMGEGKEKERERNSNVRNINWLLLVWALTRLEPAIQACALTSN